MKKHLYLLLVVLSCALLAENKSALRILPYIPDPGITIDGSILDWGHVPNAMHWDHVEQVKMGAASWKDSRNLGGKFIAGWREEGLYAMALITDDLFFTNHSSRDNWKSDHLELYIDYEPELEPDRDSLGAGQVALLAMPPVFGTQGSNPQLVPIHPENAQLQGSLIAAVRTDNGYLIELFLPAALFGKKHLTEKTYFRFEAALSDCDIPDPTQERFMILSEVAWSQCKRSLLADAVLGTASGQGEAPVRSIALNPSSFEIIPGKSQIIEFDKPEIPQEKQVAFHFRGRTGLFNTHGRACNGYAQKAIQVFCNGKAVEGKRLRNRQASSTRKNGGKWTFVAPSGVITLPYSTDFEAPNRHSSYGLVDCNDICAFDLDLTDMLQPGKNTIEIKGIDDPSKERSAYIFEQVQLRFIAKPKVKVRKPAPTGELPLISPKPILTKANYAWHEDAGKPDWSVTINNETFNVQRSFSTQDGKQVTGDNQWFTVKRSIRHGIEAIHVSETIRNKTDKPLPIRMEYYVDFGKRLLTARVGGYEPFGLTGENTCELNPTSFGSTGKSGIGLMPWSDAFTVHISNRVGNGRLSIADDNLVIPANAEHVVEYLVFPIADGDFWSFINSARRVCKTNFKMEYLLGEVSNRANPPGEVTLNQLKNLFDVKKSNCMHGHNMWPMYKKADGKYQYAWGTACRKIDQTGNKLMFQHIKNNYPHVKYGLYFHCYLDPSDNAPTDYADCQILKADGQPALYGRFGEMYCPRKGTVYAAELEKVIKMIFDELECNAIYWDEFGVSNAKYNYASPWDGVSGDIDSMGRLVRLKSSVRLLSLPWRKEMVSYIKQRGAALYTNGSFLPKYAGQFQAENFVETATISFCNQTLLLSPVALGNHLSERTEIDCYNWMLNALDFGCLYAYYSAKILFDYPTLSAYMFPSTPMELHKGYIICQERIITKASGLFGWNDKAKHIVHVFDENGREVHSFNAPLRTINGRTWTELRLPEDYSAAILHEAIGN